MKLKMCILFFTTRSASLNDVYTGSIVRFNPRGQTNKYSSDDDTTQIFGANSQDTCTTSGVFGD